MSRPGDRPRGSRALPPDANPEERKRREEDAQLRAKTQRELEIEQSRAADRAERRRRGAQLSPEEEAFEVGHELRDMRTRNVIRWLVLLVVGVTLVVAGITVFEAALVGVGPLKMVIDQPPNAPTPTGPRLERTNGEVLAAQRAKEETILNNYTWIDQAGGKVSLPIEKAMELTLQKGLPVRSQGGQAPTVGAIPQGSSSGRTLETIP